MRRYELEELLKKAIKDVGMLAILQELIDAVVDVIDDKPEPYLTRLQHDLEVALTNYKDRYQDEN